MPRKYPTPKEANRQTLENNQDLPAGSLRQELQQSCVQLHEALAVAARLSDERAVKLLPLWSQDADVVLRRRALTRLALTQQPAAAETALRCLDDSDAAVRLQALRILAHFPRTEAVPLLARLARDSDAHCRSKALETLLQQSPFTAALAAAALEHSHTPGAAFDAMIVFSKLNAEQLVRLAREGIAAAFRSGDALPPENLAVLLRHVPDNFVDSLAVQGGPEWLRAALIERDAGLAAGDAGAVRRLTAACSDPAPALRAQALQALQPHDLAAPAEILSVLLEHPLPDVRRLAVEKLAHSGPLAINALRAALADKDSTVRRATYDALVLLLAEDPVSVWRKALRDKDVSLRVCAVERLVALPADAFTRDALAQAARDKNAAVRTPAVLALISRQIVLPALARAYRETLVEVLAAAEERREPEAEARPETDPALVAALVQAVAQLYPTGSLETLIAAAKYRKSAVVRRTAAEAILNKGRKLAFAACAELTDTEDVDVLKRVAAVLAPARDPRGLIPLIRALDECPGAAAALQPCLEHYPQVRQLRFLLGALKRPWPSVKRFAARALNELDSPEMIEPLLQATKDPDPDVQRAAVQALAKFSKRPEVYQRLIEIRDQSGGDDMARQHAVATLLGLDSPSVIGPLIEASRDEDVEVQLASINALGKFAARPEVYNRLIEVLDYGDIAVREKAIETLGENQVKAAVEPLIRLLGNPFLRFRAEEALMRIGDRRGYLAIKRRKIREKMFGKKKVKGSLAPTLRKGKVGLGRGGRRKN